MFQAAALATFLMDQIGVLKKKERHFLFEKKKSNSKTIAN